MATQRLDAAPDGVNIETIPEALRVRPQWVGWRVESRDGNPTKVPKDSRKNRNASTTDPATWGKFDEACRAVIEQGLDGIGFVFTADDPYTGVDLDGCRDPETGQVDAWAAEIIAALDSYTEISPSLAGVKVIVRGCLPPDTANRVKIPNAVGRGGRTPEVEIYDQGRYFTITGHHLEGTPPTIEDRQAKVDALLQKLGLDGASPTPDAPVGTIDLTQEPTEKDRVLAKAILDRHPDILGTWSRDDSRGDHAFAKEAARLIGPDPQAIFRVVRASPLFEGQERGTKWLRGLRGQKCYATPTIMSAIEEVRAEDPASQRVQRTAESATRLERRLASVRTLRDRLEQPTDIPQPLIPGLLWPGAITMLFGPTGVGKTTALVNLALQSLGAVGVSDSNIPPQERVVNLDGGLPYPTRPLRVLYLGAEDSVEMFEHLRLTSEVMAHYRVGPETRDRFHYILGRINLAAPRREDVHLTALIRWVRAREKYDLLLLDPLTRFHTGFDENDNGHMAQVMAALDAIREQTGAAIVFAHHTGKFASRAISGNRLVRSDPTAARGASVLSDQSHVVVSLTRGQGNVLALTWAKCNYAPHPRPLVFERTEGGVFHPVAGDSQLFEVQAIVERLGKGEPVGRSHVVRAVAEALHLKPSMARRWIGRTEEVAMILRVTKQGEPDADGDFVALPS